MANEDGTIQVVFNGEIYNFADIKDDLVSKGHSFPSHSDTEVIVHGYEEYGFDVVQKFRGMFGIRDLCDLKKNRLLAGARPHRHQAALLLLRKTASSSSPPRSRRSSRTRRSRAELNRQALYDYLGFEFVPAPETMFRGHPQAAGRPLPCSGRTGSADDQAVLGPEYPAPGAPAPSEGEAIERIRVPAGRLREVLRSISDVPLGAFLSGGLDSSAIVAMMRQHIPGTLRTFTIGYPDKTFSELDYAKIVADQFGTEHHVLMIERPDRRSWSRNPSGTSTSR